MAELSGPLAVAHLLRRAGFGHDPTSWETLGGRPYEEVVEVLLADLDGKAPKDPAGFDPYEPGAIQQLWLERMVSGKALLIHTMAQFMEESIELFNKPDVRRENGHSHIRD